MSDRVESPRRVLGYRRRAESLARWLLGRTLVTVDGAGVPTSGRIVETEAYLGAVDRASHAFGGRRTRRTETMYLAGGHAYVYRIYGLHWCFNVVASPAGDGGAVLVRALEPRTGLERMRERRGAVADRDLCRGPGRLAAALGITGDHDREDLRTSTRIWIEPPRRAADRVDPGAVLRAPRIGVDYAGEWAGADLRFVLRESPFVSRPVPGADRRQRGC